MEKAVNSHQSKRPQAKARRCACRSACMALASLLFITAPLGAQKGTSLQEILAQTVRGYEDGGAAVYVLLGRVSQRFNFPQGVEFDGETPAGIASIKVADGTVADIVRELVGRMPDYKWQVIDDVLNVMPRQPRNTVLDVRIHTLRLRRCAPVDFSHAIASIPEVKRWLKENRVVEQTLIAVVGHVEFPPSEPRISIEARDLTLREALNRIVKTPGLLRWAVTRYGEGGKHLSIIVE